MIHSRDISDNKRLITPHQFQVIRRTCRSSNEFIKRKPSRLAACQWYMNFTAPYRMRRRMWGVLLEVSQILEPLIHMRSRGLVQRIVIYSRRGTRYLPVVSLRIEIYDAETLFEQIDTRNERFALNAVLVQIVRVPIRGGHQDYTVMHIASSSYANRDEPPA